MIDKRARRIGWIDTARGIGIILVVVAHAQRGLIQAGILPPASSHAAADATIYAFHMPLFFMLAGLHVGRGLAGGRAPYLVDKLATIVWPYILWSLLHIGTVMLVGSVNQPLGFADMRAIPWQPVAQFWFLYALFLCHVTAIVIWPYRWLLAALTLVFVIIQAVFGVGNIALHSMQIFPFFVLAVLGGPWLIERLGGITPGAAAMIMIVGWVSLAVSRFTADVAPGDFPNPTFTFYAGAGAGIVGVIGLSVLLGDRARWLQRMGQASMAIFVTHTFFAAGLRIAAKKSGLVFDPLLLLLACSVVSLIIPWLLYEWAGRLGLTTLLGLGKYVRR